MRSQCASTQLNVNESCFPVKALSATSFPTMTLPSFVQYWMACDVHLLHASWAALIVYVSLPSGTIFDAQPASKTVAATVIALI
jgi:hypothetical protein